MNLYDELGIRPVINANATLTRLGGSVMPPEVIAAMQDAARFHVDIEELHDRIGEKLAEITGNEAAMIATGAAAGIVLAVAACASNGDPALARRLPHADALDKNEVLMFTSHRNGYDFAVRQTGVKVIEIGGATHTEPAELEAAFSPRTAAFVWFQGFFTGKGDLPIEHVIAACRARSVPVIVDGAAQLPPVENLWRFTQIGAACAIFSGGKDLRGPQTTGLVVGQRWLIQAMRRLASPNHGIGRPMKVGKEEMAGLLAAVKRYIALDHEDRRERDERVVASWCATFNALPGIRAMRVFPNEAGQPLPRCELLIDPRQANITRDELVARLWDGNPRISVSADTEDTEGILLNPMTLTDEEVRIVEQRILSLLRGA
ncbi:MAG: aminotransferase class V-fold PLP-dependent enzyme [Anaerolineae bacterium]|nr:aminotransferase class V-fold PLP-dependent enzyme [Anaerolineae bacterium]